MPGRTAPRRGRSTGAARTRAAARRRAPVSTKRVGGTRRPSVRAGLRSRVGGTLSALTKNRYAFARVLLVAVLSVAGVKLAYLQAFQAEALSEQSNDQRATRIQIPGKRGSILDRNGTELAFSVETRTLQVSLKMMRKTWNESAKKNPQLGNFETRIQAAAKYMADLLPGKTTEAELLEKFGDDGNFVFLVDDVEPSIAEKITQKFPEIAQETRAVREYPGGKLASNVVGYANWRMDDDDRSKHNLHGLIGLESSRDLDLAGHPGSMLVDTQEGNNSLVIPGTERSVRDAVAGSDLELTLDSDVQYDLQQRLSGYVARTHAKGGTAIIMDAKTGEVYALANDRTFDPEKLYGAAPELLNNRAVTTPYEPGSVNKIVTATSTIEHGVTRPSSVVRVPGQIQVADRVVRDAWPHGTLPFTSTGIFAKSSNVGTLLLAQKLGEDRWLETAKRLGLGERTGIGLPGESPGYIPPRAQWSGSTFGNLPIGQGLSMTVVQMAGMYQTIANKGVRVEPRIVRAKIAPDGTRIPEPQGERTQVVSAKAAQTVLKMLRATTQQGRNQNTGTAPAAAVEGYQISGKTGTAQQINPVTGTYSQSKYNITFAGVLPADDPRFVVGIMLDAPDTTLPVGHSAAPLFHDIASYLTQRFQIPLSGKRTPIVPLMLG